MAGAGSRFKKAGYHQPKFMIEVRGKTLFEWSMKSLNRFRQAENTFIFIARKDDDANNFIVQACKKGNIRKFEILEIRNRTDGQATTALQAVERIENPQDPIAIYNIDTYVDPAFLRDTAIRGEGWIPCFPGRGNQWSYARLDHTGRVVEVCEKKPVSHHATIGFYYFASFHLYRSVYAQYYQDDQNFEEGEKYIAPMYNMLIQNGLEVFIEHIPVRAVHCLGTPSDLVRFSKSAGKRP